MTSPEASLASVICSPPAARRSERWLRAGLFTVISSVLATVGHHLGSGDAVQWARLTAATAAVLLAVLPGAGRVRKPAPALAATLAAQLVLHRALSLPVSSRAGEPAHETHRATGAQYPSHHSASMMLVAHAVAAVTVAVLMQRADRRLSELPSLIDRLIGSATAALAAAAGRLSLRSGGTAGGRGLPLPVVRDPSRVRRQLVHVLVRRGPPSAVRSAGLPPVMR
ncbi:hypothetical protein [Streptomyces sp. NPDC002889]|uniref:hypothetical protein n=1 Tax=Streptomyces sp. NPDC002889 TaxID=3364669 RepID=UPI0036C75EAA